MLGAVGPKIGSMHGLGPQGYGARTIVSNSLTPVPVGGELLPPSDGSRQSLWPAKLSWFTRLIQSQTVVTPRIWHVPLAHVWQPSGGPPSACAAQVSAAATFGWQ